MSGQDQASGMSLLAAECQPLLELASAIVFKVTLQRSTTNEDSSQPRDSLSKRRRVHDYPLAWSPLGCLR